VKDAVELPVGKKLLKGDYISAIILFRHPPEEDELGVCEGSNIDEQVPPAYPNTESEDMDMSKKFLAVNTVAQLQALAAKENIVLRPGRKTKTDYIDAIYLARRQSK